MTAPKATPAITMAVAWTVSTRERAAISADHARRQATPKADRMTLSNGDGEAMELTGLSALIARLFFRRYF